MSNPILTGFPKTWAIAKIQYWWLKYQLCAYGYTYGAYGYTWESAKAQMSIPYTQHIKLARFKIRYLTGVHVYNKLVMSSTIFTSLTYITVDIPASLMPVNQCPDDINGKSFKTPQRTTLLFNVSLKSVINAVHGRTILWRVWNPTQTAASSPP